MTFFNKNKTRVRSVYRLVFHGHKFRSLQREYKDLDKIVDFDVHDTDELQYMMGVHLINPNVKIYLVYSNGDMYRIKLHKSFIAKLLYSPKE